MESHKRLRRGLCQRGGSRGPDNGDGGAIHGVGYMDQLEQRLAPVHNPDLVSLSTQMNPGLQAHGYLSTANTSVHRYSQWVTGWYSSNGSWATAKIRYKDFGSSTWGMFCAKR